MALWRKESFQEAKRRCERIQRFKAQRQQESLIPHNSFFISDGGGKNGVRIDYVERRQAAQRMRPAREESSEKEHE